MRRRALESPTFPLYLCVINSGQAQSRALAVCLARLTQPVLLLLLFSRVPGSYLSSPLGVEHSPPSNSPRTLTSLQRGAAYMGCVVVEVEMGYPCMSLHRLRTLT